MNKKGTFVKSVKDGKRTYKVYDDQGNHIDTLSGGRDYYAITYPLFATSGKLVGLSGVRGAIKYGRQSFGRLDLLSKAIAPSDWVLVCTESEQAPTAKPPVPRGCIIPFGGQNSHTGYFIYNEHNELLGTLHTPKNLHAVVYLTERDKAHRHLFGGAEQMAKGLRKFKNEEPVLVCPLRFAPFKEIGPEAGYSLADDLHNLRLFILDNCPADVATDYIGAIRHELTPDEVQMLMHGIRKCEQEGRLATVAGAVAHDINGILNAHPESGFTPKLHRFYKDPTGNYGTPWPFRRRHILLHHCANSEQELADMMALSKRLGDDLTLGQRREPSESGQGVDFIQDVLIVTTVAKALDHYGESEQAVAEMLEAEEDSDDDGLNEFEQDAVLNSDARNLSGSYASLDDMQPELLDPADDIDPKKLRKQMHQSHLESNPT